MRKKYVPRRAVLYVPGNDMRKIKKIPSAGADCVVLDCEDGVAMTRKVNSLENVEIEGFEIRSVILMHHMNFCSG
jgi:citrate lyase subunit beta-like protein